MDDQSSFRVGIVADPTLDCTYSCDLEKTDPRTQLQWLVEGRSRNGILRVSVYL